MNDLLLYLKCLAVSLVAVFVIVGCVIGVAEAAKLFIMLWGAFLLCVAFLGLCFAIAIPFLKPRN